MIKLEHRLLVFLQFSRALFLAIFFYFLVGDRGADDYGDDEEGEYHCCGMYPLVGAEDYYSGVCIRLEIRWVMMMMKFELLGFCLLLCNSNDPLYFSFPVMASRLFKLQLLSCKMSACNDLPCEHTRAEFASLFFLQNRQWRGRFTSHSFR